MTEITQADRAAAAQWAVGQSFGLKFTLHDPRTLYAAFAQHRTQARTEALEEAAKVAESDRLILSEARRLGSYGRTREDHAQLIATTIRTLITKGEAW